jgi:hypothetical protein
MTGYSHDATGWWLEIRIAKNVTSPPLPASGTFGLNINFRDQDSSSAHLYGWTNDYQVPSPDHFPDKVPYNWGNVYNAYQLSEDPPLIGTVVPNPDLAFEDEPYAKQLTLLEGTPPVTWSVIPGLPGLQISQSGLVSGWTPQEDAVGRLIDIEVFAVNTFGTDFESWQVCVQSHCVRYDFDGDGDVDQSDFGYLQACMSGSGVPQVDPNCADLDLDGDDDVDQTDITLFRACMAGANVPVGTTCEE